jgi:hypothetical protein
MEMEEELRKSKERALLSEPELKYQAWLACGRMRPWVTPHLEFERPKYNLNFTSRLHDNSSPVTFTDWTTTGTGADSGYMVVSLVGYSAY